MKYKDSLIEPTSYFHRMPSCQVRTPCEHWRGGREYHGMASCHITSDTSCRTPSLCRLSNHLNTKHQERKDARQLPGSDDILSSSLSETHASTQVILRPERNAQINAFTPGCIKLNVHCVSELYKYLDRVINSCSDSWWRDTIYPSERGPPSFLDRRLRRQMEQRRADACSVWARARGEKRRERDGFPSFTFRIFNVRGERWRRVRGTRCCLPTLQMSA